MKELHAKMEKATYGEVEPCTEHHGRSSPHPMCDGHGKQMDIYCFDCDCLVCRNCIVFDHKGHVCEFVSKAAPKTKDKLVERLVPLKEILVSLENATKTIKSAKSDIETQNISVAATIELLFNKLNDIIEHRKKELLENASSTTERKLSNLSVQEKEIEMALGTIQSLVDFVEWSIENATGEELMTTHTQMLNQIEVETREHQQQIGGGDGLEPVEEADIGVEMSCVEDLREVCRDKIKLKSLCEWVLDIDESEHKNAEVGNPLRFKVTSVLPAKNVFMEVKLMSSQDGPENIQAELQLKHANVCEFKLFPKVRGHHLLEITANGLPVTGSPFSLCVKFPPTQLGKPVKLVIGVDRPIDIAINSTGEILVAEQSGDIIMLDKNGHKMNSIHGFKRLESIAVDKDDNIYVTDHDSRSLFNFRKNSTLVKVVKKGSGLEEIRRFTPRGVTVIGEEVIVTQSYQPILVFSKDLQLIRRIEFNGDGRGLAHDEDGKLYICNFYGNCITVFNLNGSLLYSFSDRGSRKLCQPHSVCISGGLVYVSEFGNHCVSVFTREGKFVTCFGSRGGKKGRFCCPGGLTFDADGILYVCDTNNCRLQCF